MHTTWDVLQSYWTSDGLPLYCSQRTGEKTHTNQQCEILAKIRQTTGICLSSLCVMYPMLSVFILIFFALFVLILCHVPNVVRVHSYFFLLCLSSFCVMYLMLSVFILTFFALFVFILCHVPNVARVHSYFFLLCLSSFCVMYPMLSVFILIFFALFVFILCHVPNVVRVHSYFVCFVCLHSVSCT